jgi:hypothetical protein
MSIRRTAVLASMLLAVLSSGCAEDSTRADQAPVSHVRVRDGVGDVFLAGSSVTGERLSQASNVDVVSTDVRRTGRALRVTLTYDQLASKASPQWYVSFSLAGSADSFTRTVVWQRGRYADTGAWHQGLDLTRETSEDSFGSPCRTATAAVDYERRTLTLTVPNACFGDPAWVRVDGLEAGSREPHGPNDYTDIPLNATDEAESTARLYDPTR